MGKLPSLSQAKSNDKTNKRSLSPQHEEDDMIELNNLWILHFPMKTIDAFITCFGWVPILWKLLWSNMKDESNDLSEVWSTYDFFLWKIWEKLE